MVFSKGVGFPLNVSLAVILGVEKVMIPFLKPTYDLWFKTILRRNPWNKLAFKRMESTPAARYWGKCISFIIPVTYHQCAD